MKIALVFALLIASVCCAQTNQTTAKKTADQPLTPATKMEAFQPSVGTVVTFGYDDLGRILGVEVDVREVKDARGSSAKGLLVKVTQSEYRNESSFVDADEIPELLRGLDALLQVSTNPTQFKNFEVRYKTKGGLELSAFNGSRGGMEYAVSAGRLTQAQSFLSLKQMQELKSKFDQAQAKLASL